jgi:hypothetical protein
LDTRAIAGSATTQDNTTIDASAPISAVFPCFAVGVAVAVEVARRGRVAEGVVRLDIPGHLQDRSCERNFASNPDQWVSR